MKNVRILIISSLLTLVACNSDSSSKKTESCTFNDEPVECSTLKGNTDRDVDGDMPRGQKKPLKLNAKVKAEITLEADSIEVLETVQDEDKEINNGEEYTCSSFTQAGDTYKYKIKGDQLQLTFKGATESFKLVPGEISSWRLVENDDMGSTETTISLTKDTMEIDVVCKFNM